MNQRSVLVQLASTRVVPASASTEMVARSVRAPAPAAGGQARGAQAGQGKPAACPEDRWSTNLDPRSGLVGGAVEPYVGDATRGFNGRLVAPPVERLRGPVRRLDRARNHFRRSRSGDDPC